MKAVAGRGAGFSARDFVAKQLRRARIVIQVAHYVVADGVAHFEPDDVLVFEHAIDRQADAEAELGRGVDVFRVRDAFGDNVHRFAHQRHLHAVAQLPGAVLLHNHGHLAAAAEQQAQGFDHFLNLFRNRNIPNIFGKQNDEIISADMPKESGLFVKFRSYFFQDGCGHFDDCVPAFKSIFIVKSLKIIQIDV